MNKQAQHPHLENRQPTPELPRALARRVVTMLLLWLLLGALAGGLAAPPNDTTIGLAANAVAGMIVLPVLGVAFGLAGGHWRESLLGAGCGLASGSLTAFVVGSTRLGPSASLCLIVGACAGATFPQGYRTSCWLAGQLLSALRSTSNRLAQMTATSHGGAINP